MNTPAGRPDGAEIRRRWEQLLDDVAAACRAARDRVPADQPSVAHWFDQQVTALGGLRSISAARVLLPGETATGLLHDVPPEATDPAYADAMQRIGEVAALWQEGLRVPGWDWTANGYPPGWGRSISAVIRTAPLRPMRRRLRRARSGS